MSFFEEAPRILSEVKQGLGIAVEKGQESNAPRKVVSEGVKDILGHLRPLPEVADRTQTAASALGGLIKEAFIEAEVATDKIMSTLDGSNNPIANQAIEHTGIGAGALKSASDRLELLQAAIAFLQEHAPEILARAESAKEGLLSLRMDLAFAFGVNRAVDFLADKFQRDPEGPTLSVLPKAINEISQYEQTVFGQSS